MQHVADFADVFMNFFEKVGDTFVDMLSGTVPVLVGLLTLIQFLIGLLGNKRIERIGEFLGKNVILRYSAFPIFAGFFLGNPGSATLGKLLPEKSKPGFFAASASNGHPLTSLFPHTNPAELFVWLGVSQGIEALGLSTGALAIRYIITGIVVGIMTGICTEIIFRYLSKKNHYEV